MAQILQHDFHRSHIQFEARTIPSITSISPFLLPFSAAPYCQSLAAPDLSQSLAAQLPAWL